MSHPEGVRGGNGALQRRLRGGPTHSQAASLGAGTMAPGPDGPGVREESEEVRIEVPGLAGETRGSYELGQADPTGPVLGQASISSKCRAEVHVGWKGWSQDRELHKERRKGEAPRPGVSMKGFCCLRDAPTQERASALCAETSTSITGS